MRISYVKPKIIISDRNEDVEKYWLEPELVLYSVILQVGRPEWEAYVGLFVLDKKWKPHWDSGSEPGYRLSDLEAACLDWPPNWASGSPLHVLRSWSPASHSLADGLCRAPRPLQEGGVSLAENGGRHHLIRCRYCVWGGGRRLEVTTSTPASTPRAGVYFLTSRTLTGLTSRESHSNLILLHSRRLWRDVSQFNKLDRIGQVNRANHNDDDDDYEEFEYDLFSIWSSCWFSSERDPRRSMRWTRPADWWTTAGDSRVERTTGQLDLHHHQFQICITSDVSLVRS